MVLWGANRFAPQKRGGHIFKRVYITIITLETDLVRPLVVKSDPNPSVLVKIRPRWVAVSITTYFGLSGRREGGGGGASFCRQYCRRSPKIREKVPQYTYIVSLCLIVVCEQGWKKLPSLSHNGRTHIIVDCIPRCCAPSSQWHRQTR